MDKPQRIEPKIHGKNIKLMAPWKLVLKKAAAFYGEKFYFEGQARYENNKQDKKIESKRKKWQARFEISKLRRDKQDDIHADILVDLENTGRTFRGVGEWKMSAVWHFLLKDEIVFTH